MDYENLTVDDIRGMAFDARVSISKVLRKARVSRATFYRDKGGSERMLPLTKARLVDAIEELKNG